jgi:hypothetical protein
MIAELSSDTTYADVAELVDALVSGTSELNTRGGSSPLVRTIF